MENNAMDHGSPSAHTAPQQTPDMREIISDAGHSQESPSSTNPPPQATSSNNSQSVTDGLDMISTPQTSSSDGPSSQGTGQDASISQIPPLSQLSATRDLAVDNSASRPGMVVPPTAGQKRTADGQVKPPSPPSPAGPRNRGHSRNTSAISNASSANSRIGELSSELRTRLSYAMVKVNNGWQSNTIEEVESLASLTGSPASSTSTLHGRRNVAASPRATMIAMQRQTNHPISHPLGGDFDLFSRTESASRTYESFWRDHPTTGSSHRPHATSPPPPKASLAPSADIRPSTSSRRSHTPKFSKPPSIPTHRSDPTPRTPTQPDSRDRRVQTPSQKTIQEQDAIETLLFMSSPGNSGTMGHAGGPFGAPRPNPLLDSPHRSPLRAEFRVQDRRGALGPGRRVEFDKYVAGAGASEAGAEAKHLVRAPPPPPSSGASLDETTEGVIDRLLDRMSDASSDEDVEVPLSYEPRVAGRV